MKRKVVICGDSLQNYDLNIDRALSVSAIISVNQTVEPPNEIPPRLIAFVPYEYNRLSIYISQLGRPFDN